MPEIQLTPSQRKFQQVLTRATGLNSKVVGAWILAEMGGASSSAAQKREQAKNYNWLNIGYFDSGPGGLTKDKVFGDPVSAAKATAQFLKGDKFGASPGIQKILNYAGQSPQAQINAIATSGWASSGYNGGSSLRTLYGQAPAITPGVGAGLPGSSQPRRPLAASPTGTQSSPGSRAPSTKTVTTVIPGTPASDNRKEVLAQYLLNRHDPSSLLNAALAVKVDPGTPEQRVTKTVTVPGSTGTPKSTSTGPAKLPKGTPANPTTGGGGGASAAVKWAQSTVGVAETGGANRGPRIDQWQQRFGLKGAYWCAMWTSLAATKGGMDRSGRTPAVRDVRKAAQVGTAAYQKGFVDPRKAKPGDLVLFGNDHIGMVEKNTGSGLVMIAGNDANRVNRRTIAYGNGDIVRPKYRS